MRRKSHKKGRKLNLWQIDCQNTTVLPKSGSAVHTCKHVHRGARNPRVCNMMREWIRGGRELEGRPSLY